jgi:hypothetical protein
MATLEEEFGSAFTGLAALGDKPVPADFNAKIDAPAAPAELGKVTAPVTPAVSDQTPPANPVALDPVAPPAEPVSELEGLTEEEKAAAAGTAPTAPAASTTPPVSDREADLLARFAKAVKDTSAPAAPEHVQRAPEPAPLFSQEEVAALTQFNTDWPEVARAQSVLMRAQAQQLSNYIFGEVAKALGPKLAMLDELAERQHAVDLYSNIQDYDTNLVTKVTDWASKQPTYLRGAYDRVIQEGTAEEIQHLVGLYRKDTGAAAPAATPGTPAKVGTELSATAKKAVAALAPVGSKRSAPAPQAAPTDFSGAFAEFAKMEL